MNPEVKKIWIEALRSGAYKQGKLRLKEQDNTFCCLGVLCDISGIADWQISEDGILTYLNNDTRIPIEVERWSELDYCTENKLAQMNDDGKTFEEIANYIGSTL